MFVDLFLTCQVVFNRCHKNINTTLKEKHFLMQELRAILSAVINGMFTFDRSHLYFG